MPQCIVDAARRRQRTPQPVDARRGCQTEPTRPGLRFAQPQPPELSPGHPARGANRLWNPELYPSAAGSWSRPMIDCMNATSFAPSMSR